MKRWRMGIMLWQVKNCHLENSIQSQFPSFYGVKSTVSSAFQRNAVLFLFNIFIFNLTPVLQFKKTRSVRPKLNNCANVLPVSYYGMHFIQMVIRQSNENNLPGSQLGGSQFSWCADGLSEKHWVLPGVLLLRWLLICAQEISLCVNALYDGRGKCQREKVLCMNMDRKG